MSSDPHLPTLQDRFYAKWAVIAAILGALAGAALQYFVNRDVTDAKLLEISQELAKERSRSDNLELQLAEIKKGFESGKTEARLTSVSIPSLEAGHRSTGIEPTETTQASEPRHPVASVENKLVFPTPYYNFVITSVIKTGADVRVTFFVEATLEEKVKIAYGGCGIGGPGEISLLDENGERLELNYRNEGSRMFTKSFEQTDLFPNTKLKGNFLFLAKSESSGSKFTLTLRECAPQPGAQRVIHGLNAV